MRTAAATNSAWDWTHSGNSQTDEAPMKPGQAADAVVVENMGGDVGLPLFGAPHHGSGWVDFRASPYTENNVAYGDGHAETHHHKFDESLPWPYWTGEYVVWPGYVGYLY
jgi:prepilin-type processing-associated H-X9-DG protein